MIARHLFAVVFWAALVLINFSGAVVPSNRPGRPYGLTEAVCAFACMLSLARLIHHINWIWDALP